MKLFTAGLATETNSFSPLPTTLDDFTIIRGGVAADCISPFEAPLRVFRERALAEGWEIVEGLCAHAMPSGPTVSATHVQLCDEIIDDLRGALPVDAVLLNLHGSMQAVGCDDTEGDLLTRLRDIVGPEVPIGAVLDLHSHPTAAMLDSTTALVIYKHWPHVDSADRAAELFAIIASAARGECRPVMSVYDTRMIGLFPTEREPMKTFVADMKASESDAHILSVSFAHDHPWTDVPELGARVLVITDHQRSLGDTLAAQFGERVYALREDIAWQFPSLDDGLEEALTSKRAPVVLLDMADNPGGGAPGDGTQVLAALIARGVRDACVCLWDPMAARVAIGAGVGAELDLRVGAKSGAGAGHPLDLHVHVTGVARALTQASLYLAREMGDAAALHYEGIDIVVTTLRASPHTPECFEKLGIKIEDKRLVVVKTLNNARPGFDRVAADYAWVDAGGACNGNVRRIVFKNHEPDLWPFAR
jgi:microcystin degradation protein MlrC